MFCIPQKSCKFTFDNKNFNSKYFLKAISDSSATEGHAEIVNFYEWCDANNSKKHQFVIYVVETKDKGKSRK